MTQVSPMESPWMFNGMGYLVFFYTERTRIYIHDTYFIVVDVARNRSYTIYNDEEKKPEVWELHASQYNDLGDEEAGRTLLSFPLTLRDRERMFKLMQRAMTMTPAPLPTSIRPLWRSSLARITAGAGPCPILANLRAYRQVRREKGLPVARREFPQVTEHIVLCTKCQHSQ